MKWEFSDWMFLEYLSNPQRAAELFAQKWLLEKLPEISKRRSVSDVSGRKWKKC
ncbi:MAG: hypothetical protein ACLRNZ_04505 [Blautia massiliensis (ex Durand et al. 2017)]